MKYYFSYAFVRSNTYIGFSWLITSRSKPIRDDKDLKEVTDFILSECHSFPEGDVRREAHQVTILNWQRMED